VEESATHIVREATIAGDDLREIIAASLDRDAAAHWSNEGRARLSLGLHHEDRRRDSAGHGSFLFGQRDLSAFCEEVLRR